MSKIGFFVLGSTYIGQMDVAAAPEGAIEVPTAPPDARQPWLGESWGDLPTDLPALREGLSRKIDTWRDEQESAGITFEHSGRTWDGGLKTRTRLQPVLSLTELPAGFFWTDADNVDVPMTLPDLQALNAAHEAAIVLRGFQIHARQRQMKAEVSALQTVDQVRAYVVGWPDEAAE